MLRTITFASLFLGVSMSVYASDNLLTEVEGNYKPLSHLQEVLTPVEKELSMFDRIVSVLKRHNAEFRVVEHEAEGQSDKIAKIRGNEPKQGAKAILTMSTPTKGEPSYTLAVLPGDEALDFGKLKKLVGIKNTSMAPLDQVEKLTSCVKGSVPPFSFTSHISLVVDESLVKSNEEIVFNAGRLDRSIFLKVKDYLRVARPRLVDILKAIK